VGFYTLCAVKNTTNGLRTAKADGGLQGKKSPGRRFLVSLCMGYWGMALSCGSAGFLFEVKGLPSCGVFVSV
jgi:hypothetical protein